MVFLSRRCQNVENVHETFIIQKFPIKNVQFLDHRVQNIHASSFFRILAAMVGLKPAKRYDQPCRDKVEFVERQFE